MPPASTESARLEVDGGRSVTALWTVPPGKVKPRWTFVYAPGAGSDLTDPFGAFLIQALADQSIGTLRFQFPYAEAGRRAPDRPQILEATWRAAIAAAHKQASRIAVGGRSMGGRIASQVVAQGALADALALFAYPLHPPGRPEQRRDAHLANIGIPTLFCSGTRDAFASPDELRSLADQVPRAQLCLLTAADHSFSAPRASGRTRAHVWQEAAEGFLNWLQTLTDA